MIDLEIRLVEAFGWSLHDIDETDIETLLPFVMRYGQQKKSNPTRNSAHQVYCDQVSWL